MNIKEKKDASVALMIRFEEFLSQKLQNVHGEPLGLMPQKGAIVPLFYHCWDASSQVARLKVEFSNPNYVSESTSMYPVGRMFCMEFQTIHPAPMSGISLNSTMIETPVNQINNLVPIEKHRAADLAKVLSITVDRWVSEFNKQPVRPVVVGYQPEPVMG